MKNFQQYDAEKYQTTAYQEIETGIYLTKNTFPIGAPQIYVASLLFEQEPEQYGEEEGLPEYISQIPLEDILDHFEVWVSDFYEQINAQSDTICYQEFGSEKLENIQRLRTLIGKRIYAVPYFDSDDDEEYYHVMVEENGTVVEQWD